jgi:hypothetical protein
MSGLHPQFLANQYNIDLAISCGMAPSIIVVW